ncbi:MAG: cysteine synthase A [Myxococcota bacterium]
MTRPAQVRPPSGARVVDSLLELIGNTPLVRIPTPPSSAELWAKAEYLNPGGSIKDRICLAMLNAAEASGALRPGQTVVEPTSGNTGIGLAVCCAVKGYPLVLTMPESMSLERRALLEAYGAEIVLTPAEQVMEGAIAQAYAIVRERGAFMPQQFDNPENPQVHHDTTAAEIRAALAPEPVDAFVAAVGTGGTVSGVGRALRAARPQTRVIAVEPETSPVLSGGRAGPSKIQGIAAGFVPRNYDPAQVDEVRLCSDRLAWDTKLELARSSGLLVGISAGANIAVAREVAKELGPGHRVATVLCDTGERYFSLGTYFEDARHPASHRASEEAALAPPRTLEEGE